MNTPANTNVSPLPDRKDSLIDELKHVVDEAKTRLDQARSEVSEKTGIAAHATRQYVTENPWKALGFGAAALGVIIGAVQVSRRNSNGSTAGPLAD